VKTFPRAEVEAAFRRRMALQDADDWNAFQEDIDNRDETDAVVAEWKAAQR
jgi:hypothetical protein